MRRVRLDLLVPSSNTTMEHEFNLMRPKQATVHTARIRLREVVVPELLDMEKKIVDEALKLADAKVNVIAFGCTSGSLIRGLGHDKEIVLRIKKATKTLAVARARDCFPRHLRVLLSMCLSSWFISSIFKSYFILQPFSCRGWKLPR